VTIYYSTEEARSKLGEIIQAAIEGKTSVITYHGVPAALVSGFPHAKYVEDTDFGTATETHNR
jgi:antitoxin (DNA-binding transcriptional repressor) of toxin-antitoxin stability system